MIYHKISGSFRKGNAIKSCKKGEKKIWENIMNISFQVSLRKQSFKWNIIVLKNAE